MNTTKLAHVTKRFNVPNAQVGIENAQMFRHMIDATCVSQEVPQDVLTGHINDMRYDFLSVNTATALSTVTPLTFLSCMTCNGGYEMSNLTLVIANVSDANVAEVVGAVCMGGYADQMYNGVAGIRYVDFGSYPVSDVECCNFMRMLSMLARCGANTAVITRAI